MPVSKIFDKIIVQWRKKLLYRQKQQSEQAKVEIGILGKKWAHLNSVQPDPEPILVVDE
jgi:hypothetical protein